MGDLPNGTMEHHKVDAAGWKQRLRELAQRVPTAKAKVAELTRQMEAEFAVIEASRDEYFK
ncbi:MAG TPA: hypothetical protein VL096_00170 [Pirellulaceae bacterium]|nr:hypothetical protein [Pirellulaceae bacterium]